MNARERHREEVQRENNTILTQENQEESSGRADYQTFEAGIRMNTHTHTHTSALYQNTT